MMQTRGMFGTSERLIGDNRILLSIIRKNLVALLNVKILPQKLVLILINTISSTTPMTFYVKVGIFC